MRIMIAGAGSGCGKTTVTCAILAALKRLGKNVVSYKCGPDYIDPMFHKKATQIESFNLDIFLMGDIGCCHSLKNHSQHNDIAVIEGVMGLYDGIGKTSRISSNHLSQVTQTPVVLVVNAKGKALSLCAEIKGFLGFEKNNVVAVILNQTTATMFPFYKEMIETNLAIKVLGYFPKIPEAAIASRHLGLITANEINDIGKKIDRLADAALDTIDFSMLFEIASNAPTVVINEHVLDLQTVLLSGKSKKTVNIYVARDEAFCFHYEDNHLLLQRLGATLHFFSPLRDHEIPNDADGIILWGGYPELYATQLEQNRTLRSNIRRRHEQGIPIYAECGGFVYLQETLTDMQGIQHEMSGIIKGHVKMTDHLQQFGYVELTAQRDTMLCFQGEKINAHSFHYSVSSNEGGAFIAKKASNKDSTYSCFVTSHHLFAGYPHLHFFGNEAFAKRFVTACYSFRSELNHGINHQPPDD